MLPRKQLLLGPGERAEVLVQGGEAGSYSLEMRGFQQCFKGCFDPFAAVPANGRDLGSQRLINIDDSGTPVNDTLPTGTLANPEDLRKRPVAIRRTLNLTREPQQGKAPHYPINDKLFDDRRVDVTMKLDDVEEWTIKSPDTALASEWHNFHIHTNAFQVIAVNGKPLDRVQWQDTVNVPPNGSVTILMRPTDFVGTAVFHCHLDFHEDNGMMGVFRIAKDPTPAEVNANKIMFLRPMHHLSHARLASVSGAQHAVPGTKQSLLGRAAYLCRLAV
jgi:FtsP/CotA-like multicopper oxidase with cupredoxin domain